MNDSYLKQRMKEQSESNSEIQRRSKMTQHERSREAIDIIARDIKEHAHKRGKEITADTARSEAVKIAERAENKKA